MLRYRLKSNIDEKGNMTLSNLPFKNKNSVEVILLVNDVENEDSNIEEKIELLKTSFGTIDSTEVIPDEMLTRENIYNDNGR